jgi:glypican 6
MKLPYSLCEEEAKANSDQSGSCWNGHDAGKYTNPVVSDGLVSQEHNPEVNVDISRPDVYINEQVISCGVLELTDPNVLCWEQL